MSGHVPVLVQEVIDGLRIQAGKKYVDATIGAGGHGVEIVKKGGILLGIDTDPSAVRLASRTLSGYDKKTWRVVQGNYRNIREIALENGFAHVSGIVFDLGVSSMQLDTKERGFSYRFTDAPFDLRMDQTSGETAAQLVNRATESELYDILSIYGEEQLAGSIAEALVHARSVKHVKTVGDVIVQIESVTGKKAQSLYPMLSRVFQSFRIAVNDELIGLQKGLEGAESILAKGGRLVVVSFHSLEDRIVKLHMRNTRNLRIITKHPIVPGINEMQQNKRSRSAKLRCAEYISV